LGGRLKNACPFFILKGRMEGVLEDKILRELKPAWKDIISIWWSVFWRASVLEGLNFIITVIICAVLLIVFSLDKRPAGIEFLGFLGPILFIVMSLVADLLVIKIILGKRYKDFCLIILREIQEQNPNEAATSTWKEAISVWWSYKWRCLVVFLTASIVVATAATLLHLDQKLDSLIIFILIMGGLVIPIKMIIGKQYKGFRLVIVERG
jgi:hypothetical protein